MRIRHRGVEWEIETYASWDEEPWSRELTKVAQFMVRLDTPGKPAGYVAYWSNPGHRGDYRYFDMQMAVRHARKEGWDVSDADAWREAKRLHSRRVGPVRPLTRRARAALAARKLFERWRGWLNDEWCYVNVAAFAIDLYEDDGITNMMTDVIGGIEIDDHYGIVTAAKDLVDDLIASTSNFRLIMRAACDKASQET